MASTDVAAPQPTGVRRLAGFYHEVVAEMKRVTWPDRAQTIDATWRIIVFVLFIGAVIGLMDIVLQLVLVRGLPGLFAGR
jgi:preprotein translocase subunit SecE